MGFPSLSPIPVTWRVGFTAGKTTFQADDTICVFQAPARCQVVSGGFASVTTAIAKSKTNALGIFLYNGGTDGSGTSTIASISNATNTLAWTAKKAKALTLSSTTAWHKLDQNDHVMVKADVSGTISISGITGAFSIAYGHIN